MALPALRMGRFWAQNRASAHGLAVLLPLVMFAFKESGRRRVAALSSLLDVSP